MTDLAFNVIATNPDLRSQFAKTAKDNGFKAISDAHGIGMRDHQLGVDPLIVLDIENTLQKVSTVKVDDITADKATKNYRRWYYKVNQGGL